MKLWPWSRAPEKRASTFEGLVTDAIVQAATGGETANADGLAAVEAASGLIGRCFAGAEVSGDRFGLVSARVLELIGRELVRRGEAVFLIDGERSPRLIPVGTWDVRGGTDASRWFYRVDTFGASEHRTRLAPAASVVHARINDDPVRPWNGRSPVRIAAATAATAAKSETSARGEVSIPSARVQPLTTSAPDEFPKVRDNYGRMVKAGGIVAVQVPNTSLIPDGAKVRDWTPGVVQPAPSSGHVDLRRESARDVLAACGIPGTLFDRQADGTAMRESYRRLIFTTISPWAAIVQEELREKLDSPALTISFAGLHGADLATRGRALKQLTESGVSLSEAMAITGLSEG